MVTWFVNHSRLVPLPKPISEMTDDERYAFASHVATTMQAALAELGTPADATADTTKEDDDPTASDRQDDC